jgi:hypothetical protein
MGVLRKPSAGGCGVNPNQLIKNAIVCWNYLLLEHRLNQASTNEIRAEIRAAVANHSVISRGHVNLLGEYDFSGEKLRDSVGFWLPTGCQASQRIQCAVQHPDAGHPPAPEVALLGRPRRKIAGKQPPLAACAEQIDDGVEYSAHVRCSWMTAGFRCREVRRHQRPLCVGQI